MARDECRNLATVLFLQHRTRDVGNAPAALQKRHRTIEHLDLIPDSNLERARSYPPLRIRIATPGSGARARRIDHDEIATASEITQAVVIALRRAHLDIVCSG